MVWKVSRKWATSITNKAGLKPDHELTGKFTTDIAFGKVGTGTHFTAVSIICEATTKP